MSTTRAWARQVVGAIRSAAPVRGDTTLFLTGVPDNWPPLMAARYGVRAALDLGHAKIAVCKATGAPVSFDVVDLVTGVARTVGHWPQPPTRKRHGPVRGLAVAAFKGLGSEIAPRRGWVTMPGLGAVQGSEPVSG